MYDTNAIKNTNASQIKSYTKFPQCVKLITNSQNLPLNPKKEFQVSKQEIKQLFNDFNEQHKKDKGKECFKYTQKHTNLDQNTGEVYNIIDKEFWH